MSASTIKYTCKAQWRNEATNSDGQGALSHLNDYAIEGLLGRGASSVVHRVRSAESHECFSLKVMSRSKLRKERHAVGSDKASGRVLYMNGVEKVQREIEIMRRLQSVFPLGRGSSPPLRTITPPLRTGSKSPVSALTEALDQCKMEELSKPAAPLVAPGVVPTPAADPKKIPNVATRGLRDPATMSSSFQPTSPTDFVLSPCSDRLLRKGNPRISALVRPEASKTHRGSSFFSLEPAATGQGSGVTAAAGGGGSMRSGLFDSADRAVVAAEPGRDVLMALVEVVDDEEDDVMLVLQLAENGPLMTGQVGSVVGEQRLPFRFVANGALAVTGASFVLHYGSGTNSTGTSTLVAPVDGLPPAAVKKAMHELLSGLVFMHGRGVAHRDIKPENIFVDGTGAVRIGDFGCAEFFGPDSSVFGSASSVGGKITHTAGTLAFWPPECVPVLASAAGDDLGLGGDIEVVDLDTGAVIAPKPTAADTDDAADAVEPTPVFSAFAQDMWAAGLVLHCLLFNQMPFSLLTEVEMQSPGEAMERDPMALMVDIHACSAYPVAVASAQDPAIRAHGQWAGELLHGLLANTPEKRLNAEQALATLRRTAVRR